MSSTNGTDKAQYRLRILVVGGSIAGLGCAYTLAKAGHDVIVFEQSDGVWRVSFLQSLIVACCTEYSWFKGPSGLSQIPPNETLLLGRWGLTLEDFMKQGGNVERVVYRHGT